MIALQPRLAAAEKRGLELEREVTELEARSAGLMERWIKVGVIASGEVWADWDERVRRCARDIRRREARREREAREV